MRTKLLICGVLAAILALPNAMAAQRFKVDGESNDGGGGGHGAGSPGGGGVGGGSPGMHRETGTEASMHELAARAALKQAGIEGPCETMKKDIGYRLEEIDVIEPGEQGPEKSERGISRSSER